PRQPGVARADAQAAHLPADRILLAGPGAGQRSLLSAQVGVAGIWRHPHRRNRRARPARCTRGGAAQVGARKLPPRGSRRRRRRRHRRGRIAGAGARLSRRRRDRRVAARFRAAVSRALRIYISAGEPAAAAHAAGIPVLYYIAPQMWAWGPKRVRRLSSVNQLAVILPFEEEFFRERGVTATFVGHPLKDRAAPPARVDARRVLELDPARRTLGLFPGSRAQEGKRHWAMFREAPPKA